MKRFKIIFILSLIFATADDFFAQQKETYSISSKNIDNRNVLDKGWKFHSGDSLVWARKDYNDSSWSIITKQLFPTIVEIPKKEFNGICWLRIHLNVDSTLINRTIAFGMTPIGAAEVFVDGTLIKKFGRPSENSKSESINVSTSEEAGILKFSNAGDHVIAVRFSNWRDMKESSGMFSDLSIIGFTCYVSDWEKYNEASMKSGKMISSIIGFLCGFFCALSLLHLLLYLFFRKNRSNLYYSIFSACLFGFCLVFMIQLSGSSYANSDSDFASIFLLPILLISFIGFLHTQFYEKVPKTFWIALGISILYIILKFVYKDISSYVATALSLFIAVEAIRVVIVAIRRKKDGAKIIGTGVLIAVVFPILSIVLLVVLFAGNFSSDRDASSLPIIIANTLIWSSVLSISISMSIYLARQFAQTNKGLENQIIQIKELSEKMIEQEIEKKKILESQNEQLEFLVAERTAEVVKQKEEIEEKSTRLAEAYKDVRDSIQYAKRIQESILPSDELINSAFPNAFVLYQPKDIVSGDFYWFSHTENFAFIAVADCTGHGVPGAFMSTIGCENLNSSILKSEDVSEILKFTNQGMKKMLHQSGGEEATRDGMDIALCGFDLRNNFLNYAGANRPLWIVRKDADSVEEIKATKVAIGGLTENEQNFEKHSIQLDHGDTIYIFSDGYADQFSVNDKKLMTKRFKEIILSIQNKSMADQKTHLHQFIEQWRGNVEQVDDILVIGIRI